MENYLKELITLRTDGLVDAMKSMKEIETLFDKVSFVERRAVLVGFGGVAPPEDKPSHIAGVS